MDIRIKKWGLLLSALSLAFTAFVLPLHHHEGREAPVAQSHCTVCQLSSHTRSAVPSPTYEALQFLDKGPVIRQAPVVDPLVLLINASAPRAPPTA